MSRNGVSSLSRRVRTSRCESTAGRWSGRFARSKPFQGGHLQAEHTPVEEDEGAEGLVLGGGRDPALHREVVQEGGRLWCAHFPGVTAIVKPDEATDPVEVRFFGSR